MYLVKHRIFVCNRIVGEKHCVGVFRWASGGWLSSWH